MNNAATIDPTTGVIGAGFADISQAPMMVRKPTLASVAAVPDRMPQIIIGEGATLMFSGKGVPRIGDLILKDDSTLSMVARSALNGEGARSDHPESFSLNINNSKATISKTGTTFNLAGITDGSATDQMLFVTIPSSRTSSSMAISPRLPSAALLSPTNRRSIT